MSASLSLAATAGAFPPSLGPAGPVPGNKAARWEVPPHIMMAITRIFRSQKREPMHTAASITASAATVSISATRCEFAHHQLTTSWGLGAAVSSRVQRHNMGDERGSGEKKSKRRHGCEVALTAGRRV